MLAGLGNGWYKSLEDAADHIDNKVNYFCPDAASDEGMADRYREFKALSAEYLHRK